MNYIEQALTANIGFANSGADEKNNQLFILWLASVSAGQTTLNL